MHTSFAAVPPIPEAISTMSRVLPYNGKAVKPMCTGETVYTHTWVLVTTSKHHGKGLTTYPPWVGWHYSRTSGSCGGKGLMEPRGLK